MLNQVALAGAVGAGVANQAAHRFELVVAGKDENLLACFATFVVFFVVNVDKLVNQVENAVPCPDFFPEVGVGEFTAGGAGGRVAGPLVVAFVEGEEAGFLVAQVGGEVDPLFLRK